VNGPTDTLTMKLQELGLSFMAASLESYLADQSRNENTLLERLTDLVDLEYIPRRERAARTRLKISGMPHYKRLEDFDLSWLKGGLTKQKFSELSSLAFIDRKENIFLLGPSGVGKTHLLLGLGTKACSNGYSAYYMTCHDLVEELVRAKEQNRLKRKLIWFRKPHVLLIDEVGYEPLSAEQAHVFFQLINARYECGSIIMTSNKAFSKWAELMSDEAVATAMLDRLLHHSHTLSLQADSYRMKDRLKVGAVGFE
jgi:DNA replication protein DnaC